MLDHVTLRTTDLEGTRAFLESLLDLRIGSRPAFGFPGYWLYDGDEPIVHLVPAKSEEVDRSGEGIDHVAFRLTDYDGMCAKLDGMRVGYSKVELLELGERRLFVTTPLGILMELVFRVGAKDEFNLGEVSVT